ADGPLLEVMPLAPHDIDRGHDHARGAEAALEAVVFAESLLHRMKLPVGREALDGQDVGALGLQRKYGAGLYRLAVDVNDAGAALGGVATDVRAGEAEVLAQVLYQQRAGIDVGGDGLAVHRHGDGGHDSSSSKLRAKGPFFCPNGSGGDDQGRNRI